MINMYHDVDEWPIFKNTCSHNNALTSLKLALKLVDLTRLQGGLICTMLLMSVQSYKNTSSHNNARTSSKLALLLVYLARLQVRLIITTMLASVQSS